MSELHPDAREVPPATAGPRSWSAGLGVLAGPGCGEPLVAAAGGLRCTSCQREFVARGDAIDLAELPEAARPQGAGPRLMHSRRLAAIYDRHWRPAFMTAAIGSKLDPEREAARIERWLEPAHGGDVIDLSCGPGLIGRRLARAGAFRRVFGADLSGAMLDVCARECAREAAPMVLVRADAGRLPFASGTIAGIHAGAALHMWPDPAGAVAEVGRVLAPGGVFVASTFIHRHSGPGKALASLAMAALERRMAVRVFELSELRGYCHDAGLVDVDARPRGNWVWLRAVRSDAPATRPPGCRSRPDSASWGTVPG